MWFARVECEKVAIDSSLSSGSRARQLDLGLIHRIRYTTPQSSLSDSTDTTSDTCVDWDKSIGNRSLSDLAINFVCAFHLTILQISAFFLFPNFQKGRLLYICPVGWSVGRRHH